MGRRRKKTSVFSSIASVIIVIIIGIISTNYEEIETHLGLSNDKVNVITAEESQNITLEGENFLKIYFFDVGQADSILISNNGESMLIDAGNNDDGDLVVNNIKKLGISKLNYVVGTHPHEDHIGGLDDVIDNLEIENIFMPKVQANTKTFEDVLDSIANKELKIESPEVGKKFNVGDATCEIMLCGNGSEEEENNLNLSSIVIRVSYGSQSYLFMGDSETENEESRSWPQTNVIKIGHHGSDTSTSESFLNQVLPQIAIIQVGEGNSYGHPKQKVIERLNKLGTLIYRTDKKGNILLESDGKNNKISFVQL